MPFFAPWAWVIFGVEDVHHQPGAALAREADAFGVDQAGMLDRVDAGADRGADAGGAMGVGGDAKAPLMGLLGDRAKFLLGQLLLARLGVAREDAAGGADLDHLGAVVALLADPVAKLLRAVADRLAVGVEGGRQEGLVAMAAGRAAAHGRRGRCAGPTIRPSSIACM